MTASLLYFPTLLPHLPRRANKPETPRPHQCCEPVMLLTGLYTCRVSRALFFVAPGDRLHAAACALWALPHAPQPQSPGSG